MTPILMPQIGQDSPRGKIVQWLKYENDPVTKGEVLLTVESDKAIFEVTAERSGVLLQVLHPVDAEVEILQPVGYLGDAGESLAPAASAAATPPAPNPILSPAPGVSGPEAAPVAPPASPAVRRLARERGVDLAFIHGTGPGGRITLQDVAAAAPPLAVPEATADRVVPFDRMRQHIADRLTLSAQTIPHFHLFLDVDMTEAQQRRAAANRMPGIHVTVTDLLLAAVAPTLREFPRLNAFVERDRLMLKLRINLGVATATGGDPAPGGAAAEEAGGLLVPVIRDADRLAVAELSARVRQVVAEAQRGVVDSTVPATFTITSLGKFGIGRFLPLINPPEAAILAVGAIAPRLVPSPSGPAAREIMGLTLACDHRAVDGAYAARFLCALQNRLETPAALFAGLASDRGSAPS